MKHKIAIMTQPLGLNYGGIIQNYALQKVLENNGHETITICRIGENPHSKIKIIASKYKRLLFRHLLHPNNPAYFDHKTIANNNESFLKKHIHRSPEINTNASLLSYFNQESFSAVVVGSDQVWRPRYSPNIYNFFLDFLQNNSSIKKVAYAASFGTEDWEYTEEQTNKVSEQIQQFDAVSVRENSGVLLCDNYLNRKDVVHVLDPTLLLNAKDYDQLINQTEKEIGLFTYVLDETTEKLNFIHQCSKTLNLNINKNQAKYSIYSDEGSNVNDYVIPPIEGWLQGFRDAEYVITDSFHGMVFSIINHKPFLAIVNKSRGASRFESLLQKLGLEDRLIYDIKDFNDAKLKNKIDYISVQEKLNVLKTLSFDFLKRYF